MNNTPRHRAPLWASLLLLLAFVAAQPILAEHIHIEDSDLVLCELGFNHVPGAVATKFKFSQDSQAPLYLQRQAPVTQSTQPERQSARGPPTVFLLSR